MTKGNCVNRSLWVNVELVVPFLASNYWMSFALTLMKLCLNGGSQDIGHQYGVSARTVARRFQVMLNILYIRFNLLMFWPDH